MRKLNFFTILVLLSLLFCGCTQKSKYYIESPKSKDLNPDSISELSSDDVELIKNYIPKVINWYNSINITKSQSEDFVTNEISNMGNELWENQIYQSYLSNFKFGTEQTEEDRIEYTQISTVNAIYGEIATIMMTSNHTYVLYGSSNESNSMTINEDDWIELGEIIKKAVSYYYK